MSNNEITINTCFNFLDEIDLAVQDKNRIIGKINNTQVKNLVQDGSNIAISTGNAKNIKLSAAAGTAGAVVAGVAAGANAALAGGAVGFTGGAAIAGKFAVAGGTAAGTAGAAKGAALGTLAGPIGAVAGAGLGVLVGLVIGKFVQNKAYNEKQRLFQELLKKQTKAIKELRNEKDLLERDNSKLQQQISRYRYIIGVLQINDELVAKFEAA